MDCKLRNLQAMKDRWGNVWVSRQLSDEEVNEFQDECMKRNLKLREVFNYLKPKGEK